MTFEVYGRGRSLRVAFFNRGTFGDTLTEDINISEISDFNDTEVHLFSTDNKNFSVFGTYESHLELDKKNDVREIYSFIFDYIKEHKIEICIFFGSGYSWHESFLLKLKEIAYIACYFGDDPEGSSKTSKFYVKNFNYAFCGGIFYNDRSTIEEKYIEWGAKRAKFIPLGVCPAKYSEPIRDLNQRSVDLVYVGGCYFPKVFRMFRLKWHFGDRMRMYGRGWNKSGSIPKTLILKIIKFFFRIHQIEELPKEQLIGLYQDSKIGFNIHMSYGPSNLRLYELPMNGVMQICDCWEGLSRLYEIDKEVVFYETIGDAIKKIEYYLDNENERIKIAWAGYEKVRNNYKWGHSFVKIFNEISLDVKKNLSN